MMAAHTRRRPKGSRACLAVGITTLLTVAISPALGQAVCVKGDQGNVARVLEGPIPDWKYFGGPMTGRGSKGTSYGLPRFRDASFTARFPFGTVTLSDDSIPLKVSIIGWSPFIPGESDDSSLPVGAMEYHFHNPTDRQLEAVFSYHSRNFMALAPRRGHSILPLPGGFILHQDGSDTAPHEQGEFAIFADDPSVVVDHGWFRGAHYDAFTLVWRNIEEGIVLKNPPMKGPSPGASLYVPFSLGPGEQRTIRVMFAWYAPHDGIEMH